MAWKSVQCHCPKCDKPFESLLDTTTNAKPQCPECQCTEIEIIPVVGGYRIRGDNSASRTPRGAGAFRKKKGKR